MESANKIHLSHYWIVLKNVSFMTLNSEKAELAAPEFPSLL